MTNKNKIQELENLVIQAWKDVTMCSTNSKISKKLFVTAVQRANQLEAKLALLKNERNA